MLRNAPVKRRSRSATSRVGDEPVEQREQPRVAGARPARAPAHAPTSRFARVAARARSIRRRIPPRRGIGSITSARSNRLSAFPAPPPQTAARPVRPARTGNARSPRVPAPSARRRPRTRRARPRTLRRRGLTAVTVIGVRRASSSRPGYRSQDPELAGDEVRVRRRIRVRRVDRGRRFSRRVAARGSDVTSRGMSERACASASSSAAAASVSIVAPWPTSSIDGR